MRRSQRGYSSYRGRRTLTDVLKIVAAVLGVVVVLLLAVIWLSRNGAELPLKLPSVSQQDEGQSAGSADGQEGSTSQPGGSEDGEQTSDTSQQGQTGQENVLAALELPVSAVLDGTAAAQLEQAGANALVLTMKDEEGMLAWNSQQALAQSCGVSSGEDVQEQLRAWNQGEVYTVARVCCFRDNTIPYHRNNLALRASYGNWRDEKDLRWLNPASEEAQDYLASLCGELAAMGFDEILLECAAFPTAGAVERITSETGDRAQVVSAFLTRVEQAVAAYDTRVSLRVEAGTLTGELPQCGITDGLLSELEGPIWVAAGEGADPLALLTQAGVSDAQARLVEVVPQLSDGGVRSQAKLTE